MTTETATRRQYKDRCTSCGGQATHYIVVYDHNPHHCADERTTMLLVATCEQCRDALGSFLFNQKHANCMGTLVDIDRVDALLAGREA